MLKLLIADATEEFRLALTRQVTGIYLVRCCADGREALEMINSFKPDILVLDLMLPRLDGISLLQQAADQGARPMVLATTRFVNDYVLDAAARLGVGYVMVKPCDVHAAAARLEDLSGHLKPMAMARPDARTVVSNVILKLGIPTKLRGYAYLREAILLAMRQPEQMVTKEIYPEVGRLCKATRDQVERSIRSAIATAYERRDDRVWAHFFAQDSQGVTARPSNGTFIRAVAVRLANEKEFCEIC